MLRYNLVKNDFEYSKADRSPNQSRKASIRPQSGISNPIVGETVTQKARPKTARRMHSVNIHSSQIVFGEEPRKSELKSHTKSIYKPEVYDKENHNIIANQKIAGISQSTHINFTGKQEPMKTAKAQRPEMIKNVFQSQISFA